jgi:23S rRNA pseudouridine2605 synthase
VRVFGDVTPEILQKLLAGVELEDGLARFERIAPVSEGSANDWFKVVLREGRKREVRRLWESQGLKVSRLIRIRFGPVELPRNMSRGDTRELGASAVKALCQRVGIEVTPDRPRAPRASAGRPRRR